MKQPLLILIITFGLIESIVAQKVQIPERISITDQYSSPWRTNLFYKYEMELNGAEYTIQRTAFEENGKKINRTKKLGIVDKKLIEKIILEITTNPTKEIKPGDFQRNFPMDSIDAFF